MKEENFNNLSSLEYSHSKKSEVKGVEGISGVTRISLTNNYLRTINKRLSLITSLIPFLGTLLAVSLLWYAPVSQVAIGLLIIMYALTTFGLEVGFHRYFSHRSFQTTTPIRIILAVLGSMAASGGVVFWVAHHRRHHRYTDKPGDPHSPHLFEEGILGRVRGLWHAQLGWLLEGEVTNSMIFAKELVTDPVIAKINQMQQVCVILGLFIPTVLGGIITGTWMGALQGFLWGGLVRIFLGQHIISATNSICHIIGSTPFKSGDRSTNNIWLAILSWGQSWHNNHHAFPTSAIAGLEWWQIDPGTWVIRTLELFNLVWDVKTPTSKMIEAKESA
jgi:stearoyl-CoA desaturase (delta-9 desaturase)